MSGAAEEAILKVKAKHWPIVILLLGPIAAAAGEIEGSAPSKNGKIERQLDAFCAKWMDFLALRERDNRAAIDWQTGPDGVQGEFVGYSREHDCLLKDGTAKVPVGTIKYHEYRYMHVGASAAEALAGTPRIVEATEVLEIFRYSGGKWVY